MFWTLLIVMICKSSLCHWKCFLFTITQNSVMIKKRQKNCFDKNFVVKLLENFGDWRTMFTVGLTAPYWFSSFTNRLLFLCEPIVVEILTDEDYKSTDHLVCATDCIRKIVFLRFCFGLLCFILSSAVPEATMSIYVCVWMCVFVQLKVIRRTRLRQRFRCKQCEAKDVL